jgi:hypothetical protein
MLACCLALGTSLTCTPAATPAPAASTSGDANTEPARAVTERTAQPSPPSEPQVVPDPGTEAALRRHIESVQRGAPDYNDLTPQAADMIRSQPPCRDDEGRERVADPPEPRGQDRGHLLPPGAARDRPERSRVAA